jgi:beta-glucosidase
MPAAASARRGRTCGSLRVGVGRRPRRRRAEQSFGLSFADWWANQAAPGGDIVTTVPYVNITSGQQQQQASVYYASVSLEPGKTPQYVILPPDVSQGATTGHTEMHIFALAIG